MYIHGLENTVTERLSTSYMLIVIEKTQSTFVAISSHVTIGGGIVNWDHVINLRDASLSGSSRILH
jgi:hypothetical protein